MLPLWRLRTLSLDIFSTYLKLRVLWTMKSPTAQPMALDALRARFVPLGDNKPTHGETSSEVSDLAPMRPH